MADAKVELLHNRAKAYLHNAQFIPYGIKPHVDFVSKLVQYFNMGNVRIRISFMNAQVFSCICSFITDPVVTLVVNVNVEFQLRQAAADTELECVIFSFFDSDRAADLGLIERQGRARTLGSVGAARAWGTIGIIIILDIAG